MIMESVDMSAEPAIGAVLAPSRHRIPYARNRDDQRRREGRLDQRIKYLEMWAIPEKKVACTRRAWSYGGARGCIQGQDANGVEEKQGHGEGDS